VSAPLTVRLAVLRDPMPMSQIDASLRRRGLAALSALPGVVEVYAGRRGPDQNGERVIATVWDSAAGQPAASRRECLEVDLAGIASTVERVSTEVFPLRLTLRFPSDAAPRVLRIFRGEIRDGRVDDYLSAARDGADRDAQLGEGPLAVHLAMTGELSFLTVSVWPGWSAIQKRTGSDMHHPVSTQHRELLRSGSAFHYEILPSEPSEPSEPWEPPTAE
jgi:hypothetical protein